MKPREALNVFYENFELWKAHNYIDTQEDENIREAYTVLEELVNEKEKQPECHSCSKPSSDLVKHYYKGFDKNGKIIPDYHLLCNDCLQKIRTGNE
jgi:hypothetical protein